MRKAEVIFEESLEGKKGASPTNTWEGDSRHRVSLCKACDGRAQGAMLRRPTWAEQREQEAGE